jgi:hypothetical protein
MDADKKNHLFKKLINVPHENSLRQFLFIINTVIYTALVSITLLNFLIISIIKISDIKFKEYHHSLDFFPCYCIQGSRMFPTKK